MIKPHRLSLIILAGVFPLHNLSCARVQKHSESLGVTASKPDGKWATVSPREILANQPDFVAKESYDSFEQAHGHSFGMKVAKKGQWYRRDTDIVAVFSSPDEPYVRYILKAKIFDTSPGLRERRAWFADAQNAAVLAKEEGVNFEAVGEEIIEGHECLKIKATKPGATGGDRGEGVTVYSYAAKDLQNLVIRTEVIQPERRTVYVLKDISFDVPDNLFEVLARYRRQTSNNGMHPTRDTLPVINL